MKLHLPKQLLVAVVTAMCSAWSLTHGADIISVNFTHSSNNIAVTDTNKDQTLGGVSTAQWQNVQPSANTQYTVEVTNQNGVKAGTLLVGNIQGTWENESGDGTLVGEIQKGYIDVLNYQSRIYTIGVDHDYWLSDVVIYMGGDTAGDNKYAPMVVNGTTYVGGTDVVKTDSNVTDGGWGTANKVNDTTRYTEYSEKNSITVTKLTGDTSIQNTYPNGNARGTVAAIQVIDRTAETVYFTTLGEGTTNAADATWELNGVATGYGEITAAGKYLGVYAAETGSTMNLTAGDKLAFLGVGSNELTVTSDGAVGIDSLYTHTADSTLNLNAALTANQSLAISGLGQVNINANQNLGVLTNAGNLHIGDNVTIVLNGGFVNKGTLTAGSGASMFSNVAADTEITFGNTTLTADQNILIDYLQDGNIMLNAAETNMEVSTTGGTLAFVKGTEAPGDIVVNLSTLTHSAGELTMAAGKGVSVTAGDYVLQANNNLTISGAGVVTLGSITTTGDNTATTLTVDAGATLQATSMAASWGRNLTVNGRLEFTGDVGLFLKSNGSPIISGTGTIKTEKLTVGNHGHYSVEVNRMEIGSGGITVKDANGYTLNMGATTIAATESWTNAVTTAFTLSDNSTGTTFEVAANAAIELNGVISNKDGATGMLVKTGDGKLTLSGANTYTGGTTITGGTLTMGNAQALGTEGGVTMSGGTLALGVDAAIKSLNVTGESTLATNAKTLTVNEGISTSSKLIVNGGGTLKVTGNLTTTGTFTLGTTEGTSVELYGTGNSVSIFDLSNDGNAKGQIKLMSGSKTTITSPNTGQDNAGALWMQAGNSILLEEDASLSWLGATVTGKTNGATISTSANRNVYLEVAEATIDNADVSYNGTAEAYTVAAKLTNSSITQNGSGTLTVNNSGNTLTAVNATGGNVKVINTTENAEMSIASVSAAAGKTVTTEVADLTIGSLTLGAGATLTHTGDLTLNGLTFTLEDYISNPILNNPYTLVSSSGTLELGSSVTVGELGMVGDYTATLANTGSSLTLTFTQEPAPSGPITTTVLSQGGFAGGMLTLNVDGDLTSATQVFITGISDSIMAEILGLSGLPADGMVGITLKGAEGGTFTATADQQIGFRGNDGVSYYFGEQVGSNWQYQVAYIPEPASATLGLAALMMLCARRRRKA